MQDFRKRKQGDNAEKRRGRRVAGEEPEEPVTRDESRGGGAKCEPGIDGHAIGGKRRDPVRCRHKVGQEGAARRPVELSREPCERRERQYLRECPGLRQKQHGGGPREHGENDRLPAPQMVGKVPSQDRGQHVAHTIGADRDARLPDGVSFFREVERQERDDEASELVQEGPEE